MIPFKLLSCFLYGYTAWERKGTHWGKRTEVMPPVVEKPVRLQNYKGKANTVKRSKTTFVYSDIRENFKMNAVIFNWNANVFI